MKKLSIILGLSVAVLMGCVFFVDPNALEPIQFLPIMLAVYVFGVSSILIGLKLFSDAQNARKQLFIAMIMGLIPAIVFSLMTLGSLAAVDMVLAILVPSLVAWYGLRIKNF